MYVEKINQPTDVKNLNSEQLHILADEMRQALLQKLSKHGGHFGPNLGMVEATIALHYVFNSPTDKIVYDVSHQSYPHKMLTGRKDAFLYEDKYDDVSGYSNPDESDHGRWIATNKSERPLYVQQPSFSTTNVLELRPGLSCALVEGSRITSSQHSGWVNVSVR